MDPDERKYRALGVLATWLPGEALSLLLVYVLHIRSLVVAAVVGVLIAFIGIGVGTAIGSEMYARRQRDGGLA